MKQLILDLGSEGRAAAAILLTLECQEGLVALMADALLAVVEEVVEQEDERRRVRVHWDEGRVE